MKRQIGTALSVVGLLAVGIGAAVLNAHVLHANSSDPGRIVVRTVGGMTMMNATTGLPSPDARSRGSERLVTAVDSTGTAATSGTTTAGVEGSMMGHMRDRAVSDTGDPAEVTSRLRMMASLTPDQRNLLRIAAMAHVRPRDVLDAAKGLTVPAAELAAIQSVAAYIGVDLRSLASVPSLPRMMDRGHGGPNDHGGMNYDN